MKYADDTYLLVASRHINTAQEKFDISQWAERNNLKLNSPKTKGLIVFRRRSEALGPSDPIVRGAERVTTMRGLGVINDHQLQTVDGPPGPSAGLMCLVHPRLEDAQGPRPQGTGDACC